MQAYQIALELELAARDQDFANVLRLYETLELEVQKFLVVVNSFLKEGSVER